MLILEETCGDTESRSKKPSVVARLMGLDSIPVQKSVASIGKVRDDSYLMNGLKAAFQQWQQQEASAYVETHHSSASEGDYRDVYEVEQQLKNAWVEERYPQKVRYEQDFYRRRLALVRRKFMEVKHLATNGEPFDSEEFQDPVEVLNSNRDLFLKFLEEPHTVFSKHLFEPQGVSVSSGKTRITVLKPSNTTGRKGHKFIKRQLLSDETVGKVNRYCWSTGLNEQKCHDLSGPTSIVVLKPTGGRSYDMKTIPSGDLASDQLITSRDEVEVVHEESLGDNLLLDEESLDNYRSNEGILSSESSGYIADDSSFDKSDSVYFDDEVGNASDLELATSATEDSWDYINKFASPLPGSSISQIPHSPEPSIIREAKKKLSERLAFVSSNINFLEQRYLSASRSTLGELLAVSEGSNKELTHSSKSFKTNDKYTEKNSQNLSRLKSLVVSSSTHGVNEFNVGISSSSITKPIAQTLVPKSKHRKLSLKDKVSSFFLSRSKRPSEDAHPGALSDVLSSFNATFLGDSNRSLDESMDLSMFPEVSL
ncbi:uncharacterized protein LOC141829806 [Curcuma longa]|uniref:uncharacterized protein LOC141829806 n=1 Tax=Curcuma longa TaxID=136217 RepID=UPI003D9E017C